MGVHILLKAGELLLRRAAADEHEARVFVLRRDIIAAAAVIAAGLLCLGGAGRTACAALLIAVVAAATAVLIALAVLLGRLSRAGAAVVPLIAGTAACTITAIVLAALGRLAVLHRGRNGLGRNGGGGSVFLGRTERGGLRGAHKVGVELRLGVAAAACALCGGIALAAGAVVIVTAAVVGFLAIKLLKWIVTTNKLQVFAYYTLVLGVITLIVSVIEAVTGTNLFTGMPL